MSPLDLAGIGTAAAAMAGVPASSCNAHETALARRVNAEAELAELEVAERRRAVRASDRDVHAGRLSVDTDEDSRIVTICGAEIAGGPELKIGLRPDQLLWLAQQLLAAKGRLERAKS